jgi:uncharacterized protein YdeI (YjbR/CyaY-like superfamily)
MTIRFFASSSQFRTWLKKNHGKAQELYVGFHKIGSGKPSITYSEALDEALCFGWIDGVRKSLNSTSYTIRFTPRKPKSTWSMVNTKRVRELAALARMQPAGTRAFEARDESKSKLYSYEAKNRELPGAYVKKLKANGKAWSFFQTQAPYYRRTASWWIVSAKKEETRLKRLDILIQDSAKQRRVGTVIGKSTNAK